MEMIIGILKESFFLLNKMSVYLLFGFIFAGIIHVFLNEKIISRHLSSNNFAAVVKAALFGIPLPLCSCGVIPAALSLKRDGASKGAIFSFLISTPTTGIDSILATYSLLGGFFAFYRVLAAFIMGIFAGISQNLLSEKNVQQKPSAENRPNNCHLCDQENHHASQHSLMAKIKGVFVYAFDELLRDTGKWILLGIFVGGAISYLIPEEFISAYMGQGLKSMLIMWVIGIPMYVCATGSIPIAAALLLKGLNPGAAFVFLIAGPATNSAALTVIIKEFGIRAVSIFLATIFISSISLGALLDYLWRIFPVDINSHIMKHEVLIPYSIEIIASLILVISIVRKMLPKKFKSNP